MKFKIEHHENKTLTWWHTRATKIDFDPPYQRRGGLWSDYDKAFLVDSIINGFDIPKLYVADFSWNDNPKLNPKKSLYAIIDGKQRLQAIFDFLDDKIALNNDFVYLKDHHVKAHGLKYKALQKSYPSLAETIETYNLSVVKVVSDSVEPINELFVRLNRSKALTGAEIRNAMNGPTPQVIKALATHRFFDENCSFPKGRGQDLNAAAKVLLFEFYGGIIDTKKRTLDKLVAEGNQDSDRLELAARRASQTLDDLAEVFLPRDKTLTSSGLIPILYLFYQAEGFKKAQCVKPFWEDFHLQWKSDVTKRNKVFDEFDTLDRSTNDEQSIRRRVEILVGLWKKWV